MKRLICLLLGVSSSVYAETITLETDITLTPPSQTIIAEEYNPAGFVERVKITPTWGVPYYLAPVRGGDTFDAVGTGFLPVVHTAQWILLEW